MSTDPKRAFSWPRFMLAAALAFAAISIANAAAVGVSIAANYFFAVAFISAGAVILLANGLVLGYFLVRLLRKRSASAWGALTGFVGVLAVVGYFAIRILAYSLNPMTAVPMLAVSPIPPGSGYGQIAFVSSDGHISLIDADSGNFTSLGPGEEPAWSPDGRKLAYDGPCDKKNCIYFMTADGRLTRFVDNSSNSYQDAIWSPDGTKIAFEKDSGIFIVNADGSQPTQIAGASSLVWSPDGRKLAYDGPCDKITCIYIMNADGSHPTLIATGYSPAWSPDGKRIAFTHSEGYDLFAKPHLYLANADGSGVTALKKILVEEGQSYAWSPGSRQIAFWGGSGGLYVVSADGADLGQISNGQIGAAAWSPDGKHIVYQSDRLQIYVANADGSGEVILTDHTKHKSNGANPSWSPDGTRIAVMAPPPLA